MRLTAEKLRQKKQKRADWHDYRSPSTYMITILKAPGIEDLSTIESPESGRYYTRFSSTGLLVKDSIIRLKGYVPGFMVWRWVIMPDHIHIILRVNQWLEHHLGFYISAWKSELSTANSGNSVFAEGYNDRISRNSEQTLRMKGYVADNPRRYWIKKHTPDFFTRRSFIDIEGEQWEMMGNRFLLDDPEISSVRARRRFSPDELSRAKEAWRMTIDNGGVVAGAFISPHERELLDYAINEYGRIIYIMPNGFGPRYKPHGRFFDLCAEGRLLLIAPPVYNTRNEAMTYSKAKRLNEMADKIAAAQWGER